MQTETMTVTGRKRGGCPIKLSESLKDRTGVSDVQISLASGEVIVRYDESRTSSPQLKRTVVRCGFGIDSVAAINGHDPRPNCWG